MPYIMSILAFLQEFYSVAWTTVEMTTGHKTNLLAAAGKLKEIRLLHPERLVCYAEMKGHKDEIACMVFHSTKPTILFSGDSKVCCANRVQSLQKGVIISSRSHRPVSAYGILVFHPRPTTEHGITC